MGLSNSPNAGSRSGIFSHPPRRGTAIVLSAVIFVIYCWYVYSGTGSDLYEWSKSFAPYSVRQYLGMSKRYLLQYGHTIFLFGLLVMSRYIFTSEEKLPLTGPVTNFITRYSTAIFLFHFPFLFFFAAVTNYDHTSVPQQLALLVATIVSSLVMGRLCFFLKPSFDRWQNRVLKRAEERFPRPAQVETSTTPLAITRSHSEFLNQIKVVAMICVVLGHFSFHRLTTMHIPGFDGAAPRFAVPTFFMISGYFLMLSIDRRKIGAVAMTCKRGLSLYYIIIPMLIVTVILDSFGFRANAELYDYSDYYIAEALRRPYTPFQISIASISSLLYLNESWWFTMIALESENGGMRAFSNDPFWFMCYLIAFSIILIAFRLVPTPRRYLVLVFWIVVFGIPILMLAPLFCGLAGLHNSQAMGGLECVRYLDLAGAGACLCPAFSCGWLRA